jgi:hydroxymethylpyrimidine pyrophosphatase-like HAD family hydrolase
VLLDGLPLEVPVIELGGALVSDFASGAPLVVHALDAAVAEQALEVLGRFELQPFIAAATRSGSALYHGALTNPALRWYREEKQRNGGRSVGEWLDPGARLPADVLSFTLLDRREVLERAAAALQERCGESTRLELFGNSYCPGYWELCVRAPTASKAAAITRVQALLGLEPSALTVFGDQRNDLDMFRIAARAVAVKNAVPELLALATQVADSNDADGVIRWLRDQRGAPA